MTGPPRRGTVISFLPFKINIITIYLIINDGSVSKSVSGKEPSDSSDMQI